jgi:hypothetical protein
MRLRAYMASYEPKLVCSVARVRAALTHSDVGDVLRPSAAAEHAARPAVGPPGLLRINPGSRIHLYRAKLV